MTEYRYKKKTYTRDELIACLADQGLTGDTADLEYIMVYVDDITTEDAEDICSELQMLTEENEEN